MTTKQISISNYGQYSSNKCGGCRAVRIGSLNLFFSYETVIAFNDGEGLVIRENSWGTTTGKHLNWINPNKSFRLSSEVFEKKLNECLKKHNLNL